MTTVSPPPPSREPQPSGRPDSPDGVDARLDHAVEHLSADWRGTLAAALVRAWQQPGPGEFPRVLASLVVFAIVAAVTLATVLALK